MTRPRFPARPSVAPIDAAAPWARTAARFPRILARLADCPYCADELEPGRIASDDGRTCPTCEGRLTVPDWLAAAAART